MALTACSWPLRSFAIHFLLFTSQRLGLGIYVAGTSFFLPFVALSGLFWLIQPFASPRPKSKVLSKPKACHSPVPIRGETKKQNVSIRQLEASLTRSCFNFFFVSQENGKLLFTSRLDLNWHLVASFVCSLFSLWLGLSVGCPHGLATWLNSPAKMSTAGATGPRQ